MRKAAVLLAVPILLLTGCENGETKINDFSFVNSSVINSSDKKAPTSNYAEFFAQDRVHDLHLELAEDDWRAILAAPQAKEYYSAAVTLNDITITNVGFRTRGNSSLRLRGHRGSQRYPFRLKFDKYVDNQRFLGLDEMVLINSVDDPSYLREYFGYEAFRQQSDSGYRNGLAGFISERAEYLSERLPELTGNYNTARIFSIARQFSK